MQRKQQTIPYLAILILIVPALGSIRPVPERSVTKSGVPASAGLPGRPAPARPFPQHASYRSGSILPSHVSQAAMDDSVRSFYQQWKKHYILTGCDQGEAYVWFEGTRGTNICVSEGQGYGMVIVALMAGFDPDAQATYDALYRYYKSHPSQSSPQLMAWCQNKDCHSIDGSTATDGDMDIAYSLLLADAQWGHSGTIPYREEALEIMAAIHRQEVNPQTYCVMESNSSGPGSKDFFDMRSSDFMPDHIRAFRKASGDAAWDTVLDNNYRVFRYLQKTYSPAAGLVPDFIKQIKIGTRGKDRAGKASAKGGPLDAPDSDLADNVSAIPAQPHYLESQYDGLYNFNACRVPWRVAADYLIAGDTTAAGFLTPINRWIRATTKDNPDNISAGYNLSGEDLPRRNYEALCFIAPFAVSAMISRDNQPWLNKSWDYLVHFHQKDFDYYDNSIKMITMIILSGNYWAPAS
jgi:hypothetical protein